MWWLPGRNRRRGVDDAALLAALPAQAFAFVAVLARAGTVTMLLPGLGEAEVPAPVRAGMAVALTALLLPGVLALMPAGPGTLSAAASVLGAELFCGAVLGTLARTVAQSLAMAGAVLSYMTGLSSVLQPDPALGGQSAALGRLFGMVAPVVILSTGLYALPLSALAHSYEVVAPGAWLPAGDAADSLAAAVSAAFGLSLRLAAPLLVASVVWQGALGLLARLVPQLQVYAAAAPGQILGGLALVGLLASRMLEPWGGAVRAAWLALPGS